MAPKDHSAAEPQPKAGASPKDPETEKIIHNKATKAAKIQAKNPSLCLAVKIILL